MNFALVPIPHNKLEASSKVWGPFVEGVAKRQRCHLSQRLSDVYSGQVSLIMVWDTRARKAVALIGVSYMQRGSDKIARIVWLQGAARKEWLHLNDELEQYFKSLGCVGSEAICRPGWSPEMKRFGYKLTHMHYEKDFA